MMLLMFRVAGELYAVDARRVREVVPKIAVRAVPHAPAHLAGLFDYRGRVIPVVDLGRLLGPAGCESRLSTRMIIVETEREDALLGLVAEHVSDVRAVDAGQVTATPAAAAHAPYLGAIVRVDEGLVHLLEIDRILEPAHASRLAEEA